MVFNPMVLNFIFRLRISEVDLVSNEVFSHHSHSKILMVSASPPYPTLTFLIVF